MHTTSTVDDATAQRLNAIIADLAARGLTVPLETLIRHLARKGRAH